MMRARAVVSSALPGTSAKPGARRAISCGHEGDAQGGEEQEPEGEGGDGLLGEAPGLIPALGGEDAGEFGDEGGIERAFPEQAAEQVGDLEGDEEGVGDGAGAEDGGDLDVAEEAEDAAGHGPAADGEDAADHGGGVRSRWRVAGVGRAEPGGWAGLRDGSRVSGSRRCGVGWVWRHPARCRVLDCRGAARLAMTGGAEGAGIVGETAPLGGGAGTLGNLVIRLAGAGPGGR